MLGVKKMKMKSMATLLVMIVTVLASAIAVSAAPIPVDVEELEINGDNYGSSSVIAELFERGEEIDVKIRLYAHEDATKEELEDIQVFASIDGYRYSHYEGDLVSDRTRTFDMDPDTTDSKKLSLEVPVFHDLEDVLLRIRVSNSNSESVEYTYQLRVKGLADEDAIYIRDFSVSPSDVVVAGRPLSFKVFVENLGDHDLDDVSVEVAIDELGLVDTEYLDEIESDETEVFEELLVRVPTCTKPGVYTATATVEFDRFETVTESMTITVLESDACELNNGASNEKPKEVTRSVITVPESQEVMKGTSGAVYPVMISNLGSSAKTYTLSVSGVEAWGTVRMDPAAVVIVQPESVKTVYMYVSAKEESQAGAQVFKLTVESEDDAKQVLISANVKEGQSEANNGDLRRGLEIGLMVLIIILILLGLIIGFNKLRSDKDDADDETQTYY